MKIPEEKIRIENYIDVYNRTSIEVLIVDKSMIDRSNIINIIFKHLVKESI